MRTTAPQPRRSRSERRLILERLDASGLTLADFSRETGIPAGTLSCWRHMEKQADKAKPAMIPVDVLEGPDDPNAPPGEARITVELAAGHQIVLPADVDPAVVVAIARELASC